jgi:DNA-binding NarL/FixJ family response regulator
MRALLENESDLAVVAEAADGREALSLALEVKPDVAIIDIGMPSLNGIDVTAQAIKQIPKLKVIILSMHADETYVLRALMAGAKAYLLKEATEEDLVPAIRAVAGGKSYFSPAISKILLEDYVRNLQQRGLEDSYNLLTEREREVLQLLAEGRTNKEVATLLDLGLSTVETHRSNFMQKLDLHNTAEIVLYAVRKGIIS